MMKHFKIKKLNNDGAALILAMVIVLFITVLTSLLLYVSGINYEMKTTDYRTKVSFYGAEILLEELRVQLAEDASEAAEAAYKHVLMNFSTLNTKEIREAEFQEVFFENIENIWAARGADGTADKWVDAFDAFYNPDPSNKRCKVYLSSGSQDPSYDYHVEVIETNLMTGEVGTRLERDEVNGRMILWKVRVYYEENDFLSIISTDFAIDVPDIDWSVDANDNTAPITAAQAQRTSIDIEKFVNYLNWEKQ